MRISNTSFLCGYFSAPGSLQPLQEGWLKTLCTDEERANLNNYYFPEFAQCMTEDVMMFTLPLNRTCTLDLGEEKVSFLVENIRLWEAPFHIILYAVKVQFEEVEFNLVTRALNVLRNCAYYTSAQREFIDLALAPVAAIYGRETSLDMSWLVESGNKFKLFQIVLLQEGIEKGDERLLLYDAGTLAPHTPFGTGNNSPAYIDHVLAEHTISVFAGWSGLALLDTFTLLSADTPERVVKNWEKDYFEKIYIYQLFRKVFLYTVNLHYRRRTEDVMVLEARLREFEQRYSYTSISYNFLPNIINAAMEKSLDTRQDYDQLDKMIGQEIEFRRHREEEKTNHFLTFLTCLTIFSAIYDFACLLNESFGYDSLFPSGYFGFRLVATTLLLIILIVYLLLVRKK